MLLAFEGVALRTVQRYSLAFIAVAPDGCIPLQTRLCRPIIEHGVLRVRLVRAKVVLQVIRPSPRTVTLLMTPSNFASHLSSLAAFSLSSLLAVLVRSKFLAPIDCCWRRKEAELPRMKRSTVLYERPPCRVLCRAYGRNPTGLCGANRHSVHPNGSSTTRASLQTTSYREVHPMH